MTTTLRELGSHVASGETFEDRRVYLESLVTKVVITHYEEDAVLEDQMPFTD